jgi:prepilin-type processing-associated H-X9-DG protein
MPSPTEAALAATAAVAAATGLTLTYAGLSPTSQLFGHTILAGNDPTEAALTYDDGPNDVATDALLDLLARHNARATFFMIGRFVRQRPEIVRRVHAAGHLIGNHTDTHVWLSFQSSRVIREQLLACNQALEDAIGAPIHYLRPPHGARRHATGANILLHDGHQQGIGTDRSATVQATSTLLETFAREGIRAVTVDAWT